MTGIKAPILVFERDVVLNDLNEIGYHFNFHSFSKSKVDFLYTPEGLTLDLGDEDSFKVAYKYNINLGFVKDVTYEGFPKGNLSKFEDHYLHFGFPNPRALYLEKKDVRAVLDREGNTLWRKDSSRPKKLNLESIGELN